MNKGVWEPNKEHSEAGQTTIWRLGRHSPLDTISPYGVFWASVGESYSNSQRQKKTRANAAKFLHKTSSWSGLALFTNRKTNCKNWALARMTKMQVLPGCHTVRPNVPIFQNWADTLSKVGKYRMKERKKCHRVKRVKGLSVCLWLSCWGVVPSNDSVGTWQRGAKKWKGKKERRSRMTHNSAKWMKKTEKKWRLFCIPGIQGETCKSQAWRGGQTGWAVVVGLPERNFTPL